jgi:hypothetical protein
MSDNKPMISDEAVEAAARVFEDNSEEIFTPRYGYGTFTTRSGDELAVAMLGAAYEALFSPEVVSRVAQKLFDLDRSGGLWEDKARSVIRALKEPTPTGARRE